jgi:branched-chain amino acid aminotransferase
VTLARELGYRVEERIFTIDELLAWVKTGEAALSGTAAVLSGVGTLVRGNESVRVGSGAIGPNTQRLRAALVAVQQGTAPDRHGWLKRV